MLDAEAERVAATLAESTRTLEAMQVRGADAATEVADELPALRCAFRKRCRAGLSNAVGLRCALTVLEAEANGGAEADAFRPARARQWGPAPGSFHIA